MKQVIKISGILCTSVILAGGLNTISYADAGSMEAINSASDSHRNIIGMEISTATPAQRSAVGCDKEGVLVSAVIPKHPAAVAGLKAGDIITKIDGNPVIDLSSALMAMNGLDAGRNYPFEIYRKNEDGIPQKLTIRVLVEKVQERAIGKIS